MKSSKYLPLFAISGGLLVFGLMYALIGYMHFQWNISKWPVEIRFWHGFITLVGMGAGAGIAIEKMRLEEKLLDL